MIRTFLASVAVATLGFAAPAFADGSYYHYRPYGGYAQGSYHTAPGHASRSFSAQGVMAVPRRGMEVAREARAAPAIGAARCATVPRLPVLCPCNAASA